MEHHRLPLEIFSPSAKKVLASDSMKLMAARGMAPITDPVELVSLLYQLSLDSESLKSASIKTLVELPNPILEAAITSTKIHSFVLDFVAIHRAKEDSIVEVLISNGNTSGETLSSFAATTTQNLVERIVANESRLLKSPSLIAAIYSNPKARMSTVDRIVELAFRQGVEVAEIPSWKELAASHLSISPEKEEISLEDGETDSLVEDLINTSEERGGKYQSLAELLKLSVSARVRLAVLANPALRNVLLRDPIKLVAMAAIKSPKVGESEVQKYVTNTSLHEEILTYIGGKREWTKRYSIKLALVQNPRTPIAVSLRFLPHIRVTDLRQLARSKNIPSAVAGKAKQFLKKRRG